MATRARRALVAAVGCGLCAGGCAGLIGLDEPHAGSTGPDANADARPDVATTDGATDGAVVGSVSSIAFASVLDGHWNDGGVVMLRNVTSMDVLPIPGVAYASPVADVDPAPNAVIHGLLHFIDDNGADAGLVEVPPDLQPEAMQQNAYQTWTVGRVAANALGIGGQAFHDDGGKLSQAALWGTTLTFDGAGAPVFADSYALFQAVGVNDITPESLVQDVDGTPLLWGEISGASTSPPSPDTFILAAPAPARPLADAGTVAGIAYLPRPSNNLRPEDFVLLLQNAHGTQLAEYEIGTDEVVRPVTDGSVGDGLSQLTSAALATGGTHPVVVGVLPLSPPVLGFVELVTLDEKPTVATPPVPPSLTVHSASVRDAFTAIGGCIQDSNGHTHPWVGRLVNGTLDPSFGGGLVTATDFQDWCVSSVRLDAQNRAVALLVQPSSSVPTAIVRFPATF